MRSVRTGLGKGGLGYLALAGCLALAAVPGAIVSGTPALAATGGGGGGSGGGGSGGGGSGSGGSGDAERFLMRQTVPPRTNVQTISYVGAADGGCMKRVCRTQGGKQTCDTSKVKNALLCHR